MSESQKKLFLLDGMALIYRAYFAFSKSPRINSKGLNTSAMFGFTNTLLEILNKEKPTHIAVAFDTVAPTARHTEFEAYKAHRDAIPEDLAISIPWVFEIIEGFNIPVLTMDGYEADDIIGTLAKEAERQGFTTYMMTPDKDFGQLVSEHIFMYKPSSFGSGAEILGIPEVLKKFEIANVSQVIDILGLWGDAADNIPGIPGVGEKTAKQLIADYGTVENIIANADKLKGKLADKVKEHANLALLSKKLATIITDVPIEFNEEKLRLEPVDKEKLSAVFGELEFRALAKKVLNEEITTETTITESASPKQATLFGDASAVTNDNDESNEEAPAGNLQTIDTIPHQYHLADTVEKRKSLIAQLENVKSFCFDTETTNIDANNAELVGLSFAITPHEAWYIPVPANYDEARELVHEFKAVFENKNIGKTGQNIKYDMMMLKWYDVAVQGPLFDTMLAHYLVETDMRHNMNLLAEVYLNYEPVKIETLIGEKKSEQTSMRDVDIAIIKDYAAEDADITLQLQHKLEPELEKHQLRKLFDEVEMPLIPVLAGMETEGVALDPNALVEFSAQLEKEITVVEAAVYEAAGMKFNISSPKQLGEVFFDILKIDPKAKKTKTGQYATGEDILSKLADKHPAVQMVLEYRGLVKLKNTYVDTLPSMINPRTGRIHTSYQQAVAATGRLSSNNPNLQNIPIRTERGKEVRKAFVARNANYILVSADYSQIELRIIAEFSKDESMLNAFRHGIDIHTSTASKVYNVPLDQVSSEMRRNAKMVNFGIIYGISAFGLSQRLNIPRKEAATIIENYFREFPTIKSYMDGSIESARKNGYVETILGRKRYLRDINSANAVVRGFAERNAINAPIQGSAADMIKVAMINIHQTLVDLNLKSKMILQVHDELVFDVAFEELEIIKPIIREKMVNAIQMNVPIEVEIGSGKNWLEAH
ncbi:MAG: DNA polymerase I [Bacteroidetes bacterium]|nr:DNA polymerase I [Bacteroidota bacterium]